MSTDLDKSSSCLVIDHQSNPALAGYAAPPPTPIHNTPSASAADHQAPKYTNIATAQTSDMMGYHNPEEDITYVQAAMATSSSTSDVSRSADIDALAQYLMQQSLHSTPKLSLSMSPKLARKLSMKVMTDPVVDNMAAGSSRCNSPMAISHEMDGDEVRHIDGGEGRRSCCGCLSKDQHMYRMEELEMESSSRRGEFVRVCQEVGEFHMVVRPELVEAAQQHLHEALYNNSSSCTSALYVCRDDTSPPLIPLFDVLHNSSIGHDAGLLVQPSIRESNEEFGEALFRTCKKLLRILLADVFSKNQGLSKSIFIKPLLYLCEKNQSNQPFTSDDVIMSIIFGMDDKVKENYGFHVALGSQIQGWSQGRYKVPNPRPHSQNCHCFYYDLVAYP